MSKKSPAKILKEKGLIPKDWDLRKPLSRGQKSYVTKQAAKFEKLLRRPGDFTVRKVGKSTIEQLKKAGYKTDKNKAVIPSYGDRIKINKGSVDVFLLHERHRVILSGGKDLIKRLGELSRSKPLRPGQAYAIKIGDSVLSNSVFESAEDLERYVSTLNLHSRSANDHMQLVIITTDDGDLYDGESE